MGWLRSAADWVESRLAWLSKRQGRGERLFARLLGGGGPLAFPGAWTQDRANQVQHFTGWNYVAIRALAEEIAGTPPHVAAVRTPEEARERRHKGRLLDRRARKKALANLQGHEELELLDGDHRLARLLKCPNGSDTSWSFWYRTIMYLELTGNGYWWTIPDRLGLPAEMWALPSQWVWPRWDREPGHLIDWYDVRPYGGSVGRGFKIPADEIVHFQYPNPHTPFDGYAPFTAAGVWTDVAESIDASRFASFKLGAKPGLKVTLGPEYADPDDPTIDRIRARIEAVYGGERNAGRPVILPPGATADPFTTAPAEMDYNQSADQMRDWQMAVRRVSKTIAGLTEDVNYATMVASTANFLMRAVRPKLAMIGQVGSKHLCERFDRRLIMYWPDTTPEDPQQKLQEHTAYLAAGVLTINEVRADLGREPYAHGGDDPLVPMDLSPIPLATGAEPDDLPLPAAAAQKGGDDQQQPGGFGEAPGFGEAEDDQGQPGAAGPAAPKGRGEK